MTTINNN